jgi:hypothetical protein
MGVNVVLAKKRAKQYRNVLCPDCNHWKKLKRGQYRCKPCLARKAKLALGTGRKDGLTYDQVLNFDRMIQEIPDPVRNSDNPYRRFPIQVETVKPTAPESWLLRSTKVSRALNRVLDQVDKFSVGILFCVWFAIAFVIGYA